MEEVVSLLLGRIQIWKCVTDKTFMIVLPSLQKQKKKTIQRLLFLVIAYFLLIVA